MNSIILILSKSDYDFENKDGSRICGSKIQYISDIQVNEAFKKGYPVSSSSLHTDLANKIVNISFPCLCEVTYKIVPNANGENKLVIADIKPIKNVDINSLFKVGK